MIAIHLPVVEIREMLAEDKFVAKNKQEKVSAADAAATPYINRLDALKLLPVWAKTASRVLDWYARIKERPSFKAVLTDYLTVEDIARFDAIDDSTADKARKFLNARVI